MAALLAWFSRLMTMASDCAAAPSFAGDCGGVWFAAYAVVMLPVVVWVVRWMVRMEKMRRAILVHDEWLVAQASVADADTIEAHRWRGDDTLTP